MFLVERPSISLSLFRIAVALTTGLHVLPTFVHMGDNYFQTAFKSYNVNFFTVSFVETVQKSPEWFIVVCVWLFIFSFIFFLIGFLSQLSCIVMTGMCYYFYALNSFHVGTLSWDILLVTLFLMCLMPYHGDYFSVDSLMKGEVDAYKKKRPYFLQRLLQVQVGFTFFYTSLYKIYPEGNWIEGNPIFNIMNYPAPGTTKYFLLRDYLIDKPNLCYAIGISIIITEFLMVFLLFIRQTRISAIYLGFLFHIALILTLDVPAIFFFLFPPQLLLFINPDIIIRWIKLKRDENRLLKRGKLIYDGQCQFCINSVKRIKMMDIFDAVDYVDFHTIGEIGQVHNDLNEKQVNSQMHWINSTDELYGGFEAFRKLSFKLPMIFPLIPVLYFPGMSLAGPFLYRFIAKNRFLFHSNPRCNTNTCFK